MSEGADFHTRRASRWPAVTLALLLALPPAVTAASAGPAATTSFTAVSHTAATPLRRCDDGPDEGVKFLNSEVEPFVAVDPTDPQTLVGAYQQDRWSTGGARGVVTAISTDGGATWRRIVRTKSSFCTGGNRRNGGDFERATDPWVTVAPDGDIFLMTLSLNGGNTEHAMLAMRFDRERNRWRRPRTLIREADPDFLNDKNAITADPNVPDGSVVYAVWDRVGVTRTRSRIPPGEPRFGLFGPVYVSRTTDGGNTWRTRRVYDPGGYAQTLGNQIVVVPDLDDGVHEGQVLDVFALIYPLRNTTRLALIRSDDRGRTWSGAATAARIRSVEVRDPDPDRGDGRDAVRTGSRLPDVAVDPHTGTLYAVWQDARFNDLRYDGIVLSRSIDGGETWSAPVEINKTPDSVPELNRQAFTPTVAVDGNGTVGVTYYDFRNNDTADFETLETDQWFVHCHDTVATPCTDPAHWEEVGPVGASFDMKAAPYARGYFVGDYAGLAGTPSGFVAFFARAIDAADPASIHAAVIAVP